jgi:hypothetical protein
MSTQRRVFADCRQLPSEKNCSLYIAGTVDEVFETALAHAIQAHGHADSPEFRTQLKSILKDEPAGR